MYIKNNWIIRNKGQYKCYKALESLAAIIIQEFVNNYNCAEPW